MVIEQRQGHISQGGCPRQQVVGLKDKSDLAVADARQLNLVQLADIFAIEKILSSWWACERQPRMCMQRAFARTGRSHDGDELACFDRDAHAVQARLR